MSFSNDRERRNDFPHLGKTVVDSNEHEIQLKLTVGFVPEL